MKDIDAIRQRYLRDAMPVRLGGLAANLARVKSFSDHSDHQEAVESLIDESKFFIEWAAPDAELTVQAALVELQVQLARWQRSWPRIWADTQRRRAIAEEAGRWSRRVLDMSGLLRRGPR